MIDLERKLSKKFGECDGCGKWAALGRFAWTRLCLDCLAEEEIHVKASEDCREAHSREFGR